MGLRSAELENDTTKTRNKPVNTNLLNPTGYVMHQQFNIQQLYVLPTLYLFMCFVFIWEQTSTCATYSINWLVFITEMKSVYCAVRTRSLNKAVCASYLKCYFIFHCRHPLPYVIASIRFFLFSVSVYIHSRLSMHILHSSTKFVLVWHPASTFKEGLII